jgi:hypothetical protein
LAKRLPQFPAATKHELASTLGMVGMSLFPLTPMQSAGGQVGMLLELPPSLCGEAIAFYRAWAVGEGFLVTGRQSATSMRAEREVDAETVIIVAEVIRGPGGPKVYVALSVESTFTSAS